MTFRRVLDENDYKGADLVWLLVVDWGGAIYRFSNIPVEVPYLDGDYLFEGQLAPVGLHRTIRLVRHIGGRKFSFSRCRLPREHGPRV